MQAPEKIRMPTIARAACIYTKENVYFSTAARQSDVVLHDEKASYPIDILRDNWYIQRSGQIPSEILFQ